MIPCKDCLMIPVCRHKYFIDLKMECSTLVDRLYVGKGNRSRDFDKVLEEVEKILTPSFWDTGRTDDDLPYLCYKKRAKGTFIISRKVTLVGNAR